MGVLPDGQSSVLLLFIPTLIVVATLGQTKWRLLSIFTLPFALDSIASTYMRGSFVGLAAEGLFLLCFLPRKISFRLLPIIVAGVCLVASA